MKIIVKCNYLKFEFVDINEAVEFAETALKHLTDDDKDTEINIRLEQEEGIDIKTGDYVYEMIFDMNEKGTVLDGVPKGIPVAFINKSRVLDISQGGQILIKTGYSDTDIEWCELANSIYLTREEAITAARQKAKANGIVAGDVYIADTDFDDNEEDE